MFIIMIIMIIASVDKAKWTFPSGALEDFDKPPPGGSAVAAPQLGAVAADTSVKVSYTNVYRFPCQHNQHNILKTNMKGFSPEEINIKHTKE